MEDARKEKLMALGAEVLAQVLLELSDRSEMASDWVEQLVCSSWENLESFQEKIADWEEEKDLSDEEQSPDSSLKLWGMLQVLKSRDFDPQTGMEVIAQLFETDKFLFAFDDEDSMDLERVFQRDAAAQFVKHASRCADKKKVVEMILDLNRKDPYGIRSCLVDHAWECLPEPAIRSMISELQVRANAEKEEPGKHRHLDLIASLARQIKDSKLFEKTLLMTGREASRETVLSIAEVYLESDEVDAAYSWLQKVPEDSSVHEISRDRLLIKVFRRQGNVEKLSELLRKAFRAYPCVKTLQEFLDVIGEEKRAEVISQEVARIQENPKLEEFLVRFLLSVGETNAAEEYLVRRANKLDGERYGTLLPLAKELESKQVHLAAILVYRALLVSILERGMTKAYPYGASYLKKLDSLAKSISDWKTLDSHGLFLEKLLHDHGRKWSFWSLYKPET